jgi:hypothetical protein
MRKLLTLVVLSVVAATATVPASAGVDKSGNVKRIAHIKYQNKDADFFQGGTDIDFSGKYIYAMQQGPQGGIHIFKQTKGKPKKVSFFPCPGEQNDVAAVKPGLLALGYHETTCGGPAAVGGIRMVSVKNPKKPKLLGAVHNLPGGTHTLTVYPGKPIIYASPGGLPTNGGGVEQIIDVSNPKKPKVASTFRPSPMGCHDFSFRITKSEKLGFCAGSGEAQIWDVSDPLHPTTIAHVPVPAQFPHSVAITDDGKYMVIGDEAIAGNDCVGAPTGSLWIYDISVREAPVLVGTHSVPRGQLPVGSSNYDRNTWCTAHLFNFVPGTYTLVVSWYSAGINIVDFSNPTMPEEIGHYMGTEDDITNYWSAYWYRGQIFANDRVKGLDVFEVKGLREKK